MVKRRAICLHDYVTYGHREWVVIWKDDKRVKLVRREVTLGTCVTVRKSRVKHADQTWRDNLKFNDPIQYFFFNAWVPAKIISNRSGKVEIQPSFSNFVIKEPVHSSKISKGTHNFPIWQVERSFDVLYHGVPRLVRGTGLMFPWEYGEGIPLPKAHRVYVTSLSFDNFNTESFPISMYNYLDTSQIVADLYTNKPIEMPSTLALLVTQYTECRGTKYIVSNNDNIETYIDRALDQGDDRRVNELLSVGEHYSIFAYAEYLIGQYHTTPVIDMDISYDNGKINVKLFRSTFTMEDPVLTELFNRLSVPVVYNPIRYEVCSSPEMSFILSRMLGMEDECVLNLHLRRMGKELLTLHKGWCRVKSKTYGGVLCVHGLNAQKLVRELVKIRPLKTLVIVKTNTINNWKGFAKYHGVHRGNDLVVVTTQHMFTRYYHELRGFTRVICIALPYSGSYADALSKLNAKTRWAVCQDESVELIRAWNVHNLDVSDERGVIRLTKEDQIAMGVPFPNISVNNIVCPTGKIANIIHNTRNMRRKRREVLLSKYLLHPSLVADYLGGEELDMYEGTVHAISENLNVDESRLNNILKDKCAVCLEAFDSPTVTSCGHIFCAECAAEMQSRGVSKCPMCRTKIEGYMRISDKNTPGKIVMHKGTCYRINNDRSWGAKMDYLRTYPKATIISKFSNVVKLLSSELPNKDIYCLNRAEGGRVPKSHHVIMVEPVRNVEGIFEFAYGKDLFITTLRYMVDM